MNFPIYDTFNFGRNPACGGVRSRLTTPRRRAPSAVARGRDGAVTAARASGHGLRRTLSAWAICVRAREPAFVRCAVAAREPSVDLRLRTFPTASAGSQAWPVVSLPSDHPRPGARRRTAEGAARRSSERIHTTHSLKKRLFTARRDATSDGAAAAPDVRSVRARIGPSGHKLRMQRRGFCLLDPATSCEGVRPRFYQVDRAGRTCTTL